MFARCIVLVVLLLAALGPASAEKKIALVIGNDQYQNLPPLKKAVNDARAVKAALERLGFSVTIAENVDFAAFAKAIAAFEAKVEPGDNVVFHYSGHGVAIAGRNYLIPTDMQVPEPGQESLVTRLATDAGTLVDEMQKRNPKLVFAILDACRNNPFPEAGRSIGSTRGLARMEAEPGEFILFSAGPGERALDTLGDDDRSPTSVFTRVLLDHIETPGLSLQDLAKATQGEVRRLAATVDHVQFPDYFDRTEDKPVLKSAAPSPVESVLWDKISTSTDIADYRTYVEQYPNGFFVLRALERIAALSPVDEPKANEPEALPQVAALPEPTVEDPPAVPDVPVEPDAAPPQAVARPEPIEIGDPSYFRGRIASISFSPDGKKLLASGYDAYKTVQWTLENNGFHPLHDDPARPKRWEISTIDRKGPSFAAYSPDGRRIVTGRMDGGARIWDAETGDTLMSLPIDDEVPGVLYSPGGDRIITFNPLHAGFRIWDGETGAHRLDVARPNLTSIAYSPDGSKLATRGWDGTAEIRDSATGEPIATIELEGSRPGGSLQSIAFSPDGRQVAIVGEDVEIHDAASGEPVAKLPDPKANSVAFSPNGKLIATAGYGLRLWDAASGRKLAEQSGSGDLVIFSPSGDRLAVAESSDRNGRGVIDLWNVKDLLAAAAPVAAQ